MKKPSKVAVRTPVARTENRRDAMRAPRRKSRKQAGPEKPNGPTDATARLRATIEASVDCVITIDAHSTILEFNAAAEQTFGYAREEVIGKPLTETIIPPSLREAHLRGIRASLKGGPGKLLGRRVEMPAMRADSSEFPVELTITRINSQNPPLFTAYLRDITERKQAEAALRESETKLKQAQQLANIGYWERDLVADRITWSKETVRILGLESFRGVPNQAQLLEFIHPDDRRRHQQVFSQALQGERLFDVEVRFVRPDGDIRFVHVRDEIVRDESGKPIRMFGAVQDITDRERAEANTRALLQISEKLHGTLDIDALLETLIVEAMKLTDASLGWVGLRTDEGVNCHAHISHNWKKVPFEYCWPPGVGWPGWVLSHKVPYQTNDAANDHVIVPEIRELFGVKSGIDTPILDSNGEVIGFFEVNNKKNGALFCETDLHKMIALSRIAALAMQNAISFRNLEQAREELREAEQKYREIFENAGEGIFRSTPEGRYLVANPALALMYGYDSPEELIRNRRDIAREVYIDSARREEFKRLLDEQGAVRGFEHQLVRRDGSTIWISVNARAVRGPQGEILYYEGTAQDITERNHAEEKVKATTEQLRALSANLQSAREEESKRIAREIHDELGGALTTWKWDLEEICDVISEPLDSSQVAALRTKVEAMTKLTETTLDTVRKLASELRPTALELGLVEGIEWQILQFESRTGIEVRLESSVEKVDLDDGQAIAVFRILQEALTNIQRHAQATKATITVNQVSGQFLLMIQDNGRGFTKGQEIDRQSLGLLGMRERVHLVGGEINIESAAGEGTKITVQVPLVDSGRLRPVLQSDS
jgi:PAS domain S-box-containing protein